MLLAPHEFAELKKTFDQAARSHPDLMEPWIVRLEGADSEEQQKLMWAGLRETIKQRFPLPEAA